MKYQTKNTEETRKIARTVLDILATTKKSKAVVVGLHGDLGSGKTTFTQCVARELGVLETVTSPTFVIEKIYTLKNQAFDHLIHIDAYRLEKSEELLRLGWTEISANPKNLTRMA